MLAVRVIFVFIENFRISEGYQFDILRISAMSCVFILQRIGHADDHLEYMYVHSFIKFKYHSRICTPYLNCMVLKSNFILLMHMKFFCVKKRQPQNQITHEIMKEICYDIMEETGDVMPDDAVRARELYLSLREASFHCCE